MFILFDHRPSATTVTVVTSVHAEAPLARLWIVTFESASGCTCPHSTAEELPGAWSITNGAGITDSTGLGLLLLKRRPVCQPENFFVPEPGLSVRSSPHW